MSRQNLYSATTRGIEVQVEPFYLEDRSDPSEGHYVWGYRVTIDNQSNLSVQLLSRYWRITDGTGRVEEVKGDGVVGEQPELNPGDSINIRPAARSPPHPASWSGAIRCTTATARRSISTSRRFRSTCRMREER